MIDKTGSLDLFLYADDLKIYNEINTDEDVEALQQDLERLYDWTQYSLLKFHPRKCVAMHLKSKSKNNEPNCFYNMDQTKSKNVNTENDLGIIFDDKLTFEEHINNMVKKANSIAGMLRRLFVHLDKDMFKKLFTSMVRPHLEYGVPIWNPHMKKNINANENVQRKASKRIPGLSHLTYKQRLETIKLPTLQYRRYCGDMIETYKMLHGLYDKEAIHDFLHFQPNDSRGYNFRGHMLILYKEGYKRDVRKYSFKCRVTDQWNNLPNVVVDAPSLNTFKNQLDKLWEREEIMFDSNIDIHTRTSSRQTRTAMKFKPGFRGYAAYFQNTVLYYYVDQICTLFKPYFLDVVSTIIPPI